jgi:hypothetical protein
MRTATPSTASAIFAFDRLGVASARFRDHFMGLLKSH